MQHEETTEMRSKGRMRKWVNQMLSIALLVAAPVTAVAFVGNWNLFPQGTVALARGDDPVANGLRILEPVPPNTAPPAVVTETPASDDDIVYLQNWDYTSGRGSSRR